MAFQFHRAARAAGTGGALGLSLACILLIPGYGLMSESTLLAALALPPSGAAQRRRE